MYRTGTGAIADANSSFLKGHLIAITHVYPTLESATMMLSGDDEWELSPIFYEMLPENTITEDFHISFINVETVSATDSYEFIFYVGPIGSEVEFCRIRMFAVKPLGSTASFGITCPVLPANCRLSMKMACEKGLVHGATGSFAYHFVV